MTRHQDQTCSRRNINFSLVYFRQRENSRALTRLFRQIEYIRETSVKCARTARFLPVIRFFVRVKRHASNKMLIMQMILFNIM